MSRIDDRISSGLERLIDARDATGLLDGVRTRKARRSVRRKASIAAVVTVVLATSIGSGLLLVRAFGHGSQPGGSSIIPEDPATIVPNRNGAIAFFAGTGIAFFGSQRLYVADPGWHQITPLSTSAAYDALAWSPNGRQIAFVQVFGEFGGGRLLVSSLQGDELRSGGKPTTLLETGSFIGDPTWSPGGHWIAFIQSVGKIGQGTIQYSLFAMPASGGTPTQLTHGPLDAHDPAWSPLGDSIAFSGQLLGNGNPGSDLYVLSRSGQMRDLTPTKGNPEIDPAWSPDGRRIVFASGGSEGRMLEVIRPDGSDRHVIFRCDCSGFFSGPTWSPDGRSIAVATGPATVTLMSPSGTEVRTITVPVEAIDAQTACCFAWQPLPA